MARVDFYLLNQSGEAARQLFACRLAEKAYRLGHSVHILTDERASAEQLDEMLWTFRDGSFVPHHITGPGAADAPVTIGFDDRDVRGRDLLINLASVIPACAEAFPRIAELVTSDEDCKRRGRQRFAEYRDHGHQLETHQV